MVSCVRGCGGVPSRLSRVGKGDRGGMGVRGLGECWPQFQLLRPSNPAFLDDHVPLNPLALSLPIKPLALSQSGGQLPYLEHEGDVRVVHTPSPLDSIHTP